MASSVGKQKIRNGQHSDSDTDTDNKLYMSEDTWPRYLVMTPTSEESPLSKLSPFVIEKDF